MADQKNKVEIVLEVTGGGKARQEFASVKSGLAAVNAEAQKSVKTVTSGLAPSTDNLAALRNMFAPARQDLERLKATTAQLHAQTGVMARGSVLAAASMNGLGAAALATGVGVFGVVGAFEAVALLQRAVFIAARNVILDLANLNGEDAVKGTVDFCPLCSSHRYGSGITREIGLMLRFFKKPGHKDLE